MSYKRSSLLKAGLLSCSLLVPSTSLALVIDVETDSDALTDTLFLNIPGLTVTKTELFGFEGQSGVYTNVIGTYGLPQTGIVFSSGNVLDYEAGGSTSNSLTTSYGNDGGGGGEGGGGGGGEGTGGGCGAGDGSGNGLGCEGLEFGGDFPLGDGINPGFDVQAEIVVPASNAATPNQEALLDPITGGDYDHFDVVQLNIEFEADEGVEQVTFFGAFGSEEYSEYVGSSYIDGFGLYVNGDNMAEITPFNGTDAEPVNINHPSFAPIGGTELDGVIAPGGNPVLRFDVPVTAGETNNFTLILADTSDSSLDTTVYLSSFIASNPGTGGGGQPPATGATEFDPLLPILNDNGDPVFDENGGFIIDISEEVANTGELIWVDPPVAIGYTYEVDGGALITSMQAPSLAIVDDLSGYTLSDGVNSIDVVAGQAVDWVALFGAGTAFLEVTGIDPLTTVVDSEDPMAFPFALAFANVTSDFDVTVTPITETSPGPSPVPLPATGLLYMGAVLVGGGLMRRRQKAA